MGAGFWLILISFLAYGIIHSWLASLDVKAKIRHWFGHSVDRWYRLFYNIFAAFSLLPIFALVYLLPDQPIYRIPSPWNFIFYFLQIIAMIILLVGLVQTGLGSFTGFQQIFSTSTASKAQLVSTGLYRWVRHPLYAAGLLFIWLFPYMTANMLALFISMTVYFIVGAMIEEKKLLEEFGEDYHNYQARTPMLIPGFHRKKTG